jgi:hypothetical protein
MKRSELLFIFFLNFLMITGFSGVSPDSSGSVMFDVIQQDTLPDDQVLYNGRVWQNLYYMVKEDQFLFSRDFLPGSLTIRGRTYEDVSIKYDIFKDEILIPITSGGILQLNKEMVDSFSIHFQNKKFLFKRIDSLEGLKVYLNVIYEGKSTLYVRYIKKIDLLAVEGKYDSFYQFSQIYFMRDSIIYPVSGKNDLLKVLSEDKGLINTYIKKNRLRLSKEDPESFIPVIRYFDTIRQ